MTVPRPNMPAGLEGLLPQFVAEMKKDHARLLTLVDGDLALLAEHVHAMRGKCAMFGEDILYEPLSALEIAAQAGLREDWADSLKRIGQRVADLQTFDG